MSVAFDVVFGFFVASMVVLAVVAVRWGRRRDRAAREQMGGTGRAGDGLAPSPQTVHPDPAATPEGTAP